MRRFVGLCLAMLLAVALAPGPARAAAGPEDTVRSFYATLVDTMRHGGELGRKGRYDALAPAIRHSFDLPAMARLAVGPGWATLSSAQQQRVTDAFARYTIATYADRFDDFAGEQFEITGQRAGSYGTLIDSRIVRSNGDPVRIDYLMHRNGDVWQIADVYLTGTISQVASLRSQFGAVLARQGVDGLVDALNRKAETLVANASAT